MFQKILALVLLVVACMPPTLANASDCEREVLVNVRDKGKEFFPSLRASDFRAKVDGKVVQIGAAEVKTGIARAVLAIDISGSMHNFVHNRIELAIVNDILGTFPNETQFALVAFSDHVVETVPLRHSRQEILSEVYKFSDPGEQSGSALTSLRDALVFAGTLFGTVQLGDAVIVISDGGDNKSKASFAKVNQTYSNSQIRLNAILLSDPYMQTPEEKAGELGLRNMALLSGGAVREIQSPQEQSIVRNLAEELDRYYVLKIATPNSGKRARLQLEVVDLSGKKRKDLKLSFAENLPESCAPDL